MTVAGRTVLHTGAGGGLGLETALTFLRKSARVVAIDNDPAKAAALSKHAADGGLEGLSVHQIDLADTANLGAQLDRLSEEAGGFDIVINNAAIYPSQAADAFSIEDHRAVQAVNVDAGIICVQRALPHMRDQGWGRIINISSVTFYGGWSLLAPYVQSKGALIGLTRAWAREFGPFGITVNAVAPGAFPTDAEKIHPDPEGYARYVLDHQAVKRRGTPSDIANVLIFFASEEAGFVTGQTINVDGGWVMQ
ncbi:MAG: SDR family NAD(P)-dependent oxidoreductase [Pseudomonadota bacterium]